mmetsp:Transcript_37642/g.102174  ORF Transcript_37642/g.102174 Transcript_37642/m.102174 type:complete len:229 (-) Transcript_37642:48-734(-)
MPWRRSVATHDVRHTVMSCSFFLGINPFMTGTKVDMIKFEGSRAFVTGMPPPVVRFRRELTPCGFEGSNCISVRMRREPYTACTRASCSNGGATNPPQQSPPPPPRRTGGSGGPRAPPRAAVWGGGLTGELLGAWMDAWATFATPLQTFGWRMGTSAYGRPCTFSELARRFPTGAAARRARARREPTPSRIVRRCMSRSRRAEVEGWLRVMRTGTFPSHHHWLPTPPP